ncbi:MAG: malate dehydrogenase [Planctomycetes bacterium]|nr:malate dehydrogenase [Planctomycetota bacterium]
MTEHPPLPNWWPGDEPAAPIRVAISGASGHLGYNLVFRIAAGALFGPVQSVTLSLLESPKGMRALQALSMELKDCAYPLLNDIELSSDPFEAFHGADWVILLAGWPLNYDQSSRHDLLHKNGPIYVEHGRAINLACPTARILVVAEPCNTNCMIAMHEAPNVAPERWFALNRLDRMRATAMIAEKAQVPVSKVNRVTVWGNHSESIFVDFRNSFIGERPAHELITDQKWVHEVFEPAVATRSREINSLCGTTPAAAAAQAILGTIRSISTPTPFYRRFGAAVCSPGAYDVPKGLVFGLPLRTEDGHQWDVVDDLYIDNYARARLDQNIEELELEKTAAGI